MESRQIKRHQLFDAALSRMPSWETWTTEDVAPSATFQMTDGGLKLVGVSSTRHHCKLVSRSRRRAMARELSWREYHAVRELKPLIKRGQP